MNEGKLNIYPGRAKEYAIEEARVKESNISPEDKKLIFSFYEYVFSSGSAEYRVSKLSSQIRRICFWITELDINKNLNNLDIKDLVKLISHINRLEGLSAATKADYRRCLKQFFKWYKEEDDRLYATDEQIKRDSKRFYNYILNEISTSYEQKKIDPSTIITDEDTRLVIDQGANTAKEKAFIDFMQETGCRVGESLNIHIGNIQFGAEHAEIHVPYGKTGSRNIYILRSIPTLKRYLDIHPFKNDKNSYLWLSDSPKTKNQPLLRTGAQKILNRAFLKAKVNKKHNLHWCRHSRASILAPYLTEAVLCKYMGWAVGSKEVRKYVHLCNSQVEDAFLSMHNIKTSKNTKEDFIKCVCGTLNPTVERYCYKCYQPLRLETIIQEKELLASETNKTINLLMEITRNPELLAKFNEFKKKIQEKTE